MNPVSLNPARTNPPSRVQVPPATERALEISLLPSVDSVLAPSMIPGMRGTPGSVRIDGQMTRSDDPSYRRQIHIQKTYDATRAHATVTGTVSGKPGAAPVTILEDFTYSLAGTRTTGLVGGAPEELSEGPHGGSMVNNGQIGDFDVQSRTVWSKDGSWDHHGYIYHRDGQHRIDGMVSYAHRLTADPAGARLTGQFGELPERGTIRSDGPGRVTVDRVIGPYKIHETIRSEVRLASA